MIDPREIRHIIMLGLRCDVITHDGVRHELTNEETRCLGEAVRKIQDIERTKINLEEAMKCNR
jgi:hypothetical protein